jgi:hypothetical protein
VRTLGIVRRLVGCFYCGYPYPGDVCPYCTDLPARDPLVAKVRQVLSEAERFAARG